MIPLGLAFEYPNATSGKPHYVSYATARTVADDGVWEVWNGATNSARVFRINKDGQVQVQVGTLAAPSLVAEADKDTGLNIKSATPEVELVVAGSEVLSAVAAGVTVTGTLTATGDLTATLATAAQPNITSLGTLTALTVNGAVTINTADGIDVNPGSDVDVDLLTVGVTGGPYLKWNETVEMFEINAGSGSVGLTVSDKFRHTPVGGQLAFFGSALASKQTVTGSAGGNAALQSLLSALETYGLVTDSSS